MGLNMAHGVFAKGISYFLRSKINVNDLVQPLHSQYLITTLIFDQRECSFWQVIHLTEEMQFAK
jgi:hypothetical protein